MPIYLIDQIDQSNVALQQLILHQKELELELARISHNMNILRHRLQQEVERHLIKAAIEENQKGKDQI